MHEITLEAEVRTQIGKRSRAIRREGKIPGVYYIRGEETVPVAVPEKSLKPLIYTADTHIINLKLNNGETKNCILREVQFDGVTERPLHFDLQGLREGEKITLEVPVLVTGGTPIGVREGGILQQIAYRLKISCLPKDIPEHIEVDGENLKMNQFVHVRDLKIENVTILERESASVVGVVPPVVEKEPTPAVVEGEVPAEPEVISKGKKVEEEGAEGERPAEKKAESSGKTPPAGAKEEKK